MYHRFGESNYPSTNISLKRFKEHIKELKKDKYTVLTLLEIISRLKDIVDYLSIFFDFSIASSIVPTM